jgi:outer membrane lipoprotein-sorting protein
MKQLKALLLAVSAMLVFTAINAYAESELNAREIMLHSNESSKLNGVEEMVTFTIMDEKGNARERKISIASKTYAKDDVKKTIMRFLSPADVKGTSILTFDYTLKDDEMWLYMPALRKTRRIVSSEKSKSFMGSEFTNADITSPNLEEYGFKNIGNESVGDVDCWKIEITPISEDIASAYGYSKKISWIGKKDYMTRQTIYYDLDGQLLKVMEVSEIRLLDKENQKYQAIKSQMTNKQNGRISKFTIDKIVNNPNVKDSYFTTQYLEKP